MSEPARDPLALLEEFAAGFSPAVVALCVLLGVATGWATRPPAVSSAAEAPPLASPAPSRPPAPPSPAPDDDPGPPPSKERIEAALRAGQLTQAHEWARRAGERALTERAWLLLQLTRNIRPGLLARADALLRVRTRDGRELLGAVRDEGKDALWLELPTGEELALRPAEVAERAALDRAAGEAELTARLRGDAQGAGGLGLHRQAFLAFRAGLSGLGVELLEEALKTAEGAVLVEMFAGDDVDRLRRARRLLLGEAVALPAPEPEPQPVAALPSDEEEPARPAPSRPPPTPASQDDALLRDPGWSGAEAAFREGLTTYRTTLGASVKEGAPAVRRAMASFRRAQDLLEPLLARYEDDPRLEQRLVELNALVLDCTKRLGTD